MNQTTVPGTRATPTPFPTSGTETTLTPVSLTPFSLHWNHARPPFPWRPSHELPCSWQKDKAHTKKKEAFYYIVTGNALREPVLCTIPKPRRNITRSTYLTLYTAQNRITPNVNRRPKITLQKKIKITPIFIFKKVPALEPQSMRRPRTRRHWNEAASRVWPACPGL